MKRFFSDEKKSEHGLIIIIITVSFDLETCGFLMIFGRIEFN